MFGTLGNEALGGVQNALTNHPARQQNMGGPQMVGAGMRKSKYEIEMAAKDLANARLADYMDVSYIADYYDVETGVWKFAWRYTQEKDIETVNVAADVSMADAVKIVKAAVEMRRTR